MLLGLIERDIEHREESLKRCKLNLAYLRTSPETKKFKNAKRLVEHEIFYLKDQLDKYYSVFNLLKDEHYSSDEMLPKV